MYLLKQKSFFIFFGESNLRALKTFLREVQSIHLLILPNKNFNY